MIQSNGFLIGFFLLSIFAFVISFSVLNLSCLGSLSESVNGKQNLCFDNNILFWQW